MSSCVKEELNAISKNTLIQQDVSLPIGAKVLRIDKPSVSDTSSIPGLYGSFYYNNLAYSNNNLIFNIIETVDFNLTGVSSKSSWIKKLDLIIYFENGYPTQTFSQLYMVNSNGEIIDKASQDGNIQVDAAETDANWKIINSKTKTITLTYEGAKLEKLKQTTNLYFNGIVLSQNDKNTPIHLSDENQLKINIAVRAHLEYNVNEINQ
jgi:archaellum component FlaF (FlaF/FlaG flagellin family)